MCCRTSSVLLTAEDGWMLLQGSAVYEKVVHLWLPYKGLWTNNCLAMKANQSWDLSSCTVAVGWGLQVTVFLVQGHRGPHQWHCHGHSLRVAAVQWQAPQMSAEVLRDLIKPDPHPTAKPVRAWNPQPHLHECPQGLSACLASCPLIWGCCQVLPASVQGAELSSLSGLQEKPLVPRPVWVWRSLIIDGEAFHFLYSPSVSLSQLRSSEKQTTDFPVFLWIVPLYPDPFCAHAGIFPSNCISLHEWNSDR